MGLPRGPIHFRSRLSRVRCGAQLGGLIVGRAISGLGSAGIFSGALITVANIVEVDRRSALFGAVGAV
jgi:MFS family permease